MNPAKLTYLFSSIKTVENLLPTSTNPENTVPRSLS